MRVKGMQVWGPDGSKAYFQQKKRGLGQQDKSPGDAPSLAVRSARRKTCWAPGCDRQRALRTQARRAESAACACVGAAGREEPQESREPARGRRDPSLRAARVGKGGADGGAEGDFRPGCADGAGCESAAAGVVRSPSEVGRGGRVCARVYLRAGTALGGPLRRRALPAPSHTRGHTRAHTCTRGHTRAHAVKHARALWGCPPSCPRGQF